LPCKIGNIFRYDNIKVIYIKNNEYELILYSKDFIVEFVDVLNAALKKNLNGGKEIDKSLKKDIGYLWNEDLNCVESNISQEEEFDWIGQKYLLWSQRGIATWLYEKEGKFILEITPVYRWHFKDPTPKEKGEYITYKQFIKNYKPYVVTEISADTIREWLEQTKYLLSLIEFNDDKFIIKNEENEKQYQAFMEAQKKE
jgi:hypothetical protein